MAAQVCWPTMHHPPRRQPAESLSLLLVRLRARPVQRSARRRVDMTRRRRSSLRSRARRCSNLNTAWAIRRRIPLWLTHQPSIRSRLCRRPPHPIQVIHLQATHNANQLTRQKSQPPSQRFGPQPYRPSRLESRVSANKTC